MLRFAKYFILLLIVNSYATTTDIDTQLQKVIDQARINYNISGMSLSILLPNQTKISDYTSGTLSIDNKTRIKSDNLYQVASITKNFTAVLILQLVESGKLSLNDQLGKFLPEYPKWKNITIYQLLNNTSGCYDYIDSPQWWDYVATHRDKLWTSQEVLDIAYKHKEYFAPGQGWHYSNTNYILAGLIIEKLSKQSLDQQMQNLLKSVGLNNSYYLPFPYPDTILSKMVHGYYKTFDQTTINGSWGRGAAALVSNPNQIVMWIHKLFSKQILKPQTLQIMQQTVALNNGQPSTATESAAYGLGIFRMNSPEGVIWFTPGLAPGYRSLWVYIPCDGITFSYSISNSLINNGAGFHKYMLQNIVQTLTTSKTVQQQINKYKQHTILPDYCKFNTPTKYWDFVKL